MEHVISYFTLTSKAKLVSTAKRRNCATDLAYRGVRIAPAAAFEKETRPSKSYSDCTGRPERLASLADQMKNILRARHKRVFEGMRLVFVAGQAGHVRTSSPVPFPWELRVAEEARRHRKPQEVAGL